jgi:hypothetical protein
MTPRDPSPDIDFDARMRAVHAASLQHLSPRVEAQLAQRRRAARKATDARAARSLWPWATAVTAACVLTLAIQLRPVESPSPTDAPAIARVAEPRVADPTAALAEDPDFYLWLASVDGQRFAAE